MTTRMFAAAEATAGSSPSKVRMYSSTSLCTKPIWVKGRLRTPRKFSSPPSVSTVSTVTPQRAAISLMSVAAWM